MHEVSNSYFNNRLIETKWVDSRVDSVKFIFEVTFHI